MGFLSGGFLGSGADESSTSTNTTTNVTTTTTTNVDDIGVTGEDAVSFANVLSANVGQAAVASKAEEGKTIRSIFDASSRNSQQLFQQVGNNYNQLVGGANNLIATGKQQNVALGKQVTALAQTTSGLIKNVQDRGIQFLSDLGVRQSDSQKQLLTIQRDTTNPALSLAKGSQSIIIAAIAAIGIVFLATKGKF